MLKMIRVRTGPGGGGPQSFGLGGSWLGQVPIVGMAPPRHLSGRHRLGIDVGCCVEPGPGGNQIQKCFDVNQVTGECFVSWISPEGVYPGIPP